MVVSETTRRLLGSHVDLRDLGEHRLKDLNAPERIFQLGNGTFPPLKSLNNTNVPLQLEPLLGRKTELADLLRLIRGDGARLVTLTGPGGIGKTRLALELALELVGEFAHGVWFVDLSAVPSADLVETTIATTVGAKVYLVEHIGDRDVAVVLDNFEQVIAAAADVARLLANCERLVVIVTSRETLHVAGEHEYVLRPLAEAPAVELFRQRAEAAGGEVAPSYAEVADVCARLDALPLAIELAAARTKTLAPAELRARLEQRLPLLTKGRRDAPHRQRTLRATIEWSYDLLTAGEQSLFRRLAVFEGWTLAAAEEVCGADLDTLDSLVDKSLVRHQDGRYSMLDTIGEYALDRLVTAGELEEMRDGHATYFARIADCRAMSLIIGDDPGWRQTVALEAANLHTALDWSLQRAHAENSLAILSGIWPSSVNAHRMRRWLEDALHLPADRATMRRVLVLSGLADLAMYQRDLQTMKRANEEILDVARELGDPRRGAMALTALGEAALAEGDTATARRLVEEAIDVRITQAEGFGVERSLAALADISFVEGDLEAAEELLEKCLALTREVAPRSAHVGEFLVMLGQVALHRGKTSYALAAFSEALCQGQELNEAWTIAEALEGLAAAHARSGAREVAARLAGAASALRDRAGISARLLTGADDPVPDPPHAAWRAGLAMNTDDAVEYALASID